MINSSERGRELRLLRALAERQKRIREKLTYTAWPKNDPLSTRQVTFLLACRPGRRAKVVYKLIKSGALPAEKGPTGRWQVRRKDLQAFIERLIAFCPATPEQKTKAMPPRPKATQEANPKVA
jgi:hypothetical protein